MIITGNAGSANCWATKLGDFDGSGDDGFYFAGTDVFLRSPVIDLTNVAAASLSFAQAMDIEDGHAAVVNIKDLVRNIDFAETFLDLAGGKPPEETQDESILPLMKGETPDDWRKSLCYHCHEYPGRIA